MQSSKIQKKYLPKFSKNKTSSEKLLLLSDNAGYKKITIPLNMNNKKVSPKKKKLWKGVNGATAT
jgi:hypothetical protein